MRDAMRPASTAGRIGGRRRGPAQGREAARAEGRQKAPSREVHQRASSCAGAIEARKRLVRSSTTSQSYSRRT